MAQARIDSRRMRDNFSRHAADYDAGAAVQLRAVAGLAEKLGDLRGVACSGGVLLDVGTGTGALAATLLAATPGLGLVVMDIAHGMTRETSRRLSGVVACDGDARRIPFIDGAFAGVVSSSVYQWVEDLPAAFAEAARVLTPGGTFALTLFGERTLYELRDAHRRATGECGGTRASHVQQFPSRAAVGAALAAAGFSCAVLESSFDVEYHAGVPSLLRQLKRIGAGNASTLRPRGLASRRVMARMAGLYEEDFRREAGLPATYEVITAVAVKRP